MKFVQLILFFVIFYFVECKNHVKSLTESLGQEVIEFGAPIKELPPGLDEEPSAENEETSKIPSTTRRETKRIATTTSALPKETEVEDTASQEEEEARIEKELAEIYKDTDYKSESTEATKESQKLSSVVDEDKPIARQRNKYFKFQPDVNNRADIERFRTSVDEITCEKKRLSLSVNSDTASPYLSGFTSFTQNGLVILFFVLCY